MLAVIGLAGPFAFDVQICADRPRARLATISAVFVRLT